MLTKIKQYFANFCYATKIICAASKKFFMIKCVLSVFSSILPYLPLFLWRELLNALTAFSSGETEILQITIWKIAGIYILVVISEKMLQTLSEYIVFRYNDEINYYLDNLMVNRVSSVDLEFFDCSGLKDHVNNSWSLIYSTKNMVTFVFDIIQGSIRLVVSFVLLLSLSFWMVPVAVVLCVPSVIGDRRLESIEFSFEKSHSKSRRKMDYIKDLFFGDQLHEIRLYRLKDHFNSMYHGVWHEWNRDYIRKEWKRAVIEWISAFIILINEIIVYAFAISKLLAKKIAAGDVAYYISLVSQFKGDFFTVAYRINTFNRSCDELNDVRSFIEMEPILEKTGTRIPSEHPKIEFKNVSFKYPNSENYVLKNCSFVIEFGQTVGLVGLNGSGKSTIVKLICRFYDPTEGQILIDEIDNKEYDIIKLRDIFGVLFQDYVKYSLSARENVALSCISKIDDSAAIIKACVESRAAEFINKWDNGIDENLTRRFDNNGKEISGGQWQRISLARAFFRNASVLLLDEPSAALDPVAEHEIFNGLSRIAEYKSAVLISHRLSNITLCDKIFVLENGHIIEQGSHTELLKRSGEYARLFNLQASKYIQ